MAKKILLVEDDNNLREIYEARLQAEGYDIVSARDGEEALTVAMKERPDLIISDVMMPKISGFDMLDIIRSTEETKHSKVIMMTALSQAEDKERATKLGADRYLVKSQVTLEDVAKVAREVLEGDDKSDSEAVSAMTTPAEEPAAPEIPAVAAASVSTVVPTEPAEPATPADEAVTAAPDPAVALAQTAITPAQDEPAAAIVTDEPPAQPVSAAAPIEPPVTAPDEELLPVETAPENVDAAKETVEELVQTASDEQNAIAAQIESFIDAKKTAAVSDDANSNAPEATSEPQAQQAAEPSAAIPGNDQPKKKVIEPINDLSKGNSVDLNDLLQKESEKEQMSQIAKELSSNTDNNADELTAAAALRAAARDPKAPPVEEAAAAIAPEVQIGAEGEVTSSSPAAAEQPDTPKPEGTPMPASAETVTSTPAESQNTAPAAPVIPHTNGTSIDGVSSAPAANTNQPSGTDPNTIAL